MFGALSSSVVEESRGFIIQKKPNKRFSVELSSLVFILGRASDGLGAAGIFQRAFGITGLIVPRQLDMGFVISVLSPWPCYVSWTSGGGISRNVCHRSPSLQSISNYIDYVEN